MDPTRFDNLTRTMAAGATRRQLLTRLGGALAALGASSPITGALAKGGGNSACAHFCAAVFGADTPEAGQCTSAAAHGDPNGLCAQCGADASKYCNGTCDHSSDINNCGTCGTVCGGDACNEAVCTDGQCSTEPTSGTCEVTGTCQNGECVCGLPPNCTSNDDCGNGRVCLNGGCFQTCSSLYSFCGPGCTKSCGCSASSAVVDLVCSDAGFGIGPCATDDDCPTSAICNHSYTSSNPTKPHLCTRACPGT